MIACFYFDQRTVNIPCWIYKAWYIRLLCCVIASKGDEIDTAVHLHSSLVALSHLYKMELVTALLIFECFCMLLASEA